MQHYKANMTRKRPVRTTDKKRTTTKKVKINTLKIRLEMIN
jgi:hypothetical protein